MTKSKGKAPAFQWYPGDHRRDTGVQACGFEARALWREMLDLMHDGSPRGYLTAGDAPIEPEQLARLVGVSLPKVKKWLKELEDRRVFSRTEDGIIYSRRMLRDETSMRLRAAGGSLGGSPKLGVEYNVPGYVYVMRRLPSGELKIGISTHPAKRLYRVRQQFPGQTVDLVATAQTDDMDATEAALHQEFAAYNTSGEWFRMDEAATVHLLNRLQGESKVTGKGSPPPAVAVAVASATERDLGKGSSTSGAENRAPAALAEPPAPLASPADAPDLSRWSLKQLVDALPKPAKTWLRRYYAADTTPERQRAVVLELHATLAEGAKLKGQRVRAITASRLEKKLTEMLAERPLEKPDKAIVVLLTKLADTTDLAVQRELQAQRDKVEEQLPPVDKAAAEAWLKTRPDVAAEITAELEGMGHTDPEDPLRKTLRNTAVMRRYRQALDASPTHPNTGAAA